MTKTIISFFTFVIFISIIPTNTTAQQTRILRGFVADSLSGEVLPYANVFIKELNRGTTTDSRGYFTIASIPPREYSVVFSYVGYKTELQVVEVLSYGVTDLRINLSPSDIQIGTIEITGEKIIKENETDLSLQKITMRQLENLPKGIELDIFRAIQTLPGVQTGGDLSGKFYVRGSASNENLILLDNVPIYNPYHAMGILSAIDPDMISSIEFYKGGFPVDFTGRLSSVLKINTKDGNRNSFGAKAGLSLLTAKLFLEGPIPHGSFMITGRKNYSDAVLKKFRNNNSVPADFYDVFAKINYANNSIMEDAKFSISTFLSSDKMMNENPLLEDFQWRNNSFAFNYFQITNSPLFYQIDFSVSSFYGKRIPNASGAKYLENKFNEYSAVFDFSYVYNSKDILSGGLKISEVQLSQTIANLIGLESNTTNKGTNWSIFLKYEWLRNSFIGAEAGIRLHATRYAGGGPSYFLEPRTNFTFRLTPEIALKASWNIFMQDLVTIADEYEVTPVFEPWVITPYYIKPSDAIHYVVGLDIDPLPNLSFNIEGYYKTMHNLAIVDDRRILDWQRQLTTGSGKAYGVEFLSKYRIGILSFTGAYAWMKSFRTVRGFTYPPRFDAEHNINLTLEAELGAGWGTSAMWTYTSGLPYTQIAGYYDKLIINQIGEIPFLPNQYSPFAILAATNAGRFPDYHRLDLSISKKIQIEGFKMSVDFSVVNFYNRQNIFYFRRDTGEKVNMLPFLPSINIKAEI